MHLGRWLARRLGRDSGGRDFAVPGPTSTPPSPAEPPDVAKDLQVAFPGSGGRAFEPLDRFLTSYGRPRPTGDAAPAVLAFGDSVHLRSSHDDIDPTPLGQMLEAAFTPFGGAVSIAFSAFNLQLYADFATLLEMNRTRPRLVLIPINPRSFSPQWFCNPAWRFDAVRPLFAALAADPSAPLGPVPDVLETPGFYDEYLTREVDYPLSPLRTIGEFQAAVRHRPANTSEIRERLRTIMIYHYTHPLRQDHPLLDSFTNLLRRLRRLGVEALPYITPVNRGLGRELVGPGFDRILSTNLRTVEGRAAQESAQVADWSDMLGPEAFFHAGSPTEHLRLSGRVALRDTLLRSAAARLSHERA